MDLSTVESKLRNKVYKTTNQFKKDVNLIWDNSSKYNKTNSSIYFKTE